MILHAKAFYYERLQPFVWRHFIMLLMGYLHCVCQIKLIRL
ncbi:hypothetical protein P20311_3570 [Pseudoalteromonas sp. BSi20311]|nr:hypothetical protein P20311_3570 [Pseudoalteromonas sp. BSi20311]GAA72443.1 hypothetical protein P20439_2532 [Pseudoalteromonas sp. BSi20439]